MVSSFSPTTSSQHERLSYTVSNSRDIPLIEEVRKLEDAFSDNKGFPVGKTPNEAFELGIKVIKQEKAGDKLRENLAAFKKQEDAERTKKAQLAKSSRATVKDKRKASSRADNGPLVDF